MTREETRRLLEALVAAFTSEDMSQKLDAAGDNIQEAMAIIMATQTLVFLDHGFTDYMDGMTKLGAASMEFADDEELLALQDKLQVVMDRY